MINTCYSSDTGLTRVPGVLAYVYIYQPCRQNIPQFAHTIPHRLFERLKEDWTGWYRQDDTSFCPLNGAQLGLRPHSHIKL